MSSKASSTRASGPAWSEEEDGMRARRRAFSNWQIWTALVMIGAFLVMACAAPLISPKDPVQDGPFRRSATALAASGRVPQPPGPGLILGSSSGGYDIWHALLWGARPALRFGLAVTLATALFGILVGAVSGYVEGTVGRLTMRVTDAFLAFPPIAGVFLFRQLLPAPQPGLSLTWLQRKFSTFGVDAVMLGLIVFSWMPYARLIYGNVVRLREVEYALASRSVGASAPRIIFRHLLPNAIAPAIVLAARDVGGMVILEAAFTFIGIGSGLPWGQLLVIGRDWVVGPGGNPLAYWWVFLPPTVAMVLFGLAWNLLGDGLNAALNPRLH